MESSSTPSAASVTDWEASSGRRESASTAKVICMWWMRLDRVQIFDQQGDLLYYFGMRGRAPGTFSLPAGLFIDHNDMVYVVDSYNSRVQVFHYFAKHEVS